METKYNTMKNWPEFVHSETLFGNAIRLRHLIWTIQNILPPPKSILEVGFGSGTTCMLLADLGYHVTAIDIEEELVMRLQQRQASLVNPGQIQVVRANMFNLPWDSPIFDLTYHQGVLEHFSDQQIIRALREQARVSELVVFDVPNYRQTNRPFGNERLLAPSRWRQMIKEAGLELIYETGRGFSKILYILPHFLFSRRSVVHFPTFGKSFGKSSIFICRRMDRE